MNQELPTRGQLERSLAQKVQKLYRQELEHTPKKVTCQLFGNQVAIIIEDALTVIEKTLVDTAKEIQVAQQLHTVLNQAMKAELKTVIAEVLSVEVNDILLDSTLSTSRTGAIAMLTQIPQVRDPESIPKNKQSKVS